MKKVEYLNRATGEITTDHRAAVEWYRNGDEVEIYCDGVYRCDWTH